jgi:hypothetical protein
MAFLGYGVLFGEFETFRVEMYVLYALGWMYLCPHVCMYLCAQEFYQARKKQ